MISCQCSIVKSYNAQVTQFLRYQVSKSVGAKDNLKALLVLAAVETRIRIGWNKFRQYHISYIIDIPYIIDISLTVRGRLYSSCVRSSMLHGSETWPVRKQNEVALQTAEMRMVRWACGMKLQARVPSKELRERLGLDDVISVLQQTRTRTGTARLWQSRA